MNGDVMTWIRGGGFVLGGALFWVVYFDLKDRLRPEPRRLLVAAFALGVVSAALALGAYRLAPVLGLPADPGFRPETIVPYCVLLVGPLEEGAKFLVTRLVLFRLGDFDEPVDGLIYAAVVAIGFASAENLLYAQYLDWPEQLARSLASPLTHSLFAAMWGLGLARSRFFARTRASAIAWQVGTLLASMLLHGAYDAIVLSSDALWAGALLILVLWLFVIVRARRLLVAVYPSDGPAR